MLALVIGKYGSLPVEIFEAGPTITTIGAGIGFFGRNLDIMKELGLYDKIIKMAAGPPKENTGSSVLCLYTDIPTHDPLKFRPEFQKV